MSFCEMQQFCSVYDRSTQLAGLIQFSHSPICTGCEIRGQSDLRILRYDYVDLSQLLPPRDARGDEGIFRPKPESSLPLDLGVLDLRDSLFDVVERLEESVRLHLDSRVGRNHHRVREGFAMDRAVTYLSERVQVLAKMDHALDYPDRETRVERPYSGLEVLVLIRRLHRRVRLVCGLAEKVKGMPGDCPGCQAPALRRVEDSDQVWCANCTVRMTGAEYFEVVTLGGVTANG